MCYHLFRRNNGKSFYYSRIGMHFLLLFVVFAVCFSFTAQAAPVFEVEELEQKVPQPYLTFKDVTYYTLKYQWSIQTSELTIKAQVGVLEQATGAFNPLLATDTTRFFQRDIQNPPGIKTAFNGITTTNTLSLQTLARLGTTYSVNFSNINVINPTFSPNPTDSTIVGFSITQPLLRNLVWSPQATLEKTQNLQLKAVRLQNVQNIASALFNSFSAYWQFVATKKLLDIQLMMEQNFCEIAKYADALIQEGQQGFTTAYQPHADLNLAVANRIQAEQNVKSAYNNLLFNMGFIPDDSQQVPDFVVDDFPDFCNYPGLDQEWYDRLLDKIPVNRADIIAAEVLIREADLNLRSAKNSLLPEVNAIGIANYLNTAAKGRARHVFDSTKARNPEKDYTIGFSFSFPIFNDTAKGLVKQTRAEKSQAVVNKDLLQSQVVSGFKTSYTFSNALLAEVKKNRIAALEYQKTVAAEKIKLENGLSSYFVLLTLENNWLSALTSEISSEVQFVTNLLLLRLLSGTLVEWEREGHQKITDVENIFTYPCVAHPPYQPVENFIEEYCDVEE